MKKIGLYFGSFNPVHTGHLIVAEYFATQTDLEEVWLVVSPHNPMKDVSQLAPEHHRLEMVRLAVAGNNKLQPSDIEFNLARPSYSSETLRVLQQNFPETLFTLILGEDNIPSFHEWKDYLWILENFPIRFFPRHEVEDVEKAINWRNYDAQTLNAPRIEISSTEIREHVRKGQSIRYVVSDAVMRYIAANGLYK